jgi:hypothetical protein
MSGNGKAARSTRTLGGTLNNEHFVEIAERVLAEIPNEHT